MLLFGVVQILMSQMLDFHSMVLASVVAAIMSFCYFSIGLGLGSAQVIENGKIAGSITGYPAVSVAHKLWLTFQALGDIAFACPYELILLEIQVNNSLLVKFKISYFLILSYHSCQKRAPCAPRRKFQARRTNCAFLRAMVQAHFRQDSQIPARFWQSSAHSG
ncbi:putative amino acid transporter, transmembrane domain-containing protein [Helianthus annuus]|uniref:Amino acid transporter, transmembrane domain-containing protein n=1 Tax=Helianthus annuus TaxID=4232 RepID=A0A9K3NN65_HELAN|nr:putative amino acid transporter, transmembrane domain-containing protein [Helianthus annuus]KAJ0922833.1 putative amino acid transporter, transmembrane domain-containing protein [Helianthus annuus]